jgi:hypothetical protein
MAQSTFGTYVLSLGFFEAVPLPALKQVGGTQIAILANEFGTVGARGEGG